MILLLEREHIAVLLCVHMKQVHCDIFFKTLFNSHYFIYREATLWPSELLKNNSKPRKEKVQNKTSKFSQRHSASDVRR